MKTIQDLEAMSPEERAAYNRYLNTKIMQHVAAFVLLKIAIYVGIRALGKYLVKKLED